MAAGVKDSIGNQIEGTLQGDFSKVLRNEGYINSHIAHAGARFLRDGLAEVSGAQAAQDQLNAQIEVSKEEARRNALISDEIARNSGEDSARVSLNSNRNRKKGSASGSSATGISGTSSSSSTGIQS